MEQNEFLNYDSKMKNIDEDTYPTDLSNQLGTLNNIPVIWNPANLAGFGLLDSECNGFFWHIIST